MIDPAASRAEALSGIREAFAAAGIDGAANDARFLVLHALALSQTDLVLSGNSAVGAAGADRLREVVARRLAGEPVARIIGEWEFWGLPFVLAPSALVPRPDTETLVEAALALDPDRDRPLRLLDLGTGSGCILVALLSERPRAFGIGLDRSLEALACARANARTNGVGRRAAFVNGDWSTALSGPFDLVVSNPPYIPSATIPTLAREVSRHDPHAALDGGADGLCAYRRIIAGIAGTGDARPLLAEAGALVLEVGHDQADAVALIGKGAGFGRSAIGRDLAGHDRVVTLTELHRPVTGRKPGATAARP